MKATKTRRNLLDNFYETVKAMRTLQAKLEATPVGDYHEHGYQDMFECPGGDGYIVDSRHAYQDPFSKRLFHSKDCAEMEAMK